MAKAAKSFSDKLKRKGTTKSVKHVRVIRSVKDSENGAIRFLDRIASIPLEGNLDEHLRKLVQEPSDA